VKLPHAADAIVEPEKVRDYLLSPTHPIGRFKAAFFGMLGYSLDNWEDLRAKLREIQRSRPRQRESSAGSGTSLALLLL
jgi:hypothetical protein